MKYLNPRTRVLWPIASLLLALGASTGLQAQAQSMQIPKPSENLMPNPVLGKKLFAANCASCHGADLKGTDKGPAMLHKVYEPSHHGDAAFQMAAKHGVRAHHWQFGDMKPVPAVTPDDVAHITAYVRMAQRKVGIR